MADIDLTPTEEMAANAKRGLELRRKHGRGGTAVGVARARDISNRKTLSPETVRRMHAFFSRHEKNKAGGEDDAGYIAWMLWSGDAGQGWAKRKVEQMDKSENQRSETYKAIAERLGSAATNDRPGAKARMAKWTVTPTQKHGKDIEEHTAKIGRDHWKIDSMPHLGKSVGSLYRWDEMRGLRHISTGNIEQLKRQAEAISTKQDALSDVMRGFSRPGAKAKFALNPGDFKQGERLIKEASALREKIATKRIALDSADRTLVGAIQQMKNALATEDEVNFAEAMNLIRSADKVRASFARPGAKARFGYADAQVVGGDIVWPSGMTLKILSHSTLEQKSKEMQDAIKRNRSAWVADYKLRGPKGATYSLDVYANGTYILTPHNNPRPMLRGQLKASRPGAKDTNALYMIEIVEGGRVTSTITPDQFRNWAVKSLPGVSRNDFVPTMMEKWNDYAEEHGFGARVRIGGKSKNALSDACWSGYEAVGTKQKDGKTVPNCVPKDTNAVREGSKISAEDEACLKVMSAADEKVSDKIRTLIAEGKPQKQAVAIALDLKRRGEL